MKAKPSSEPLLVILFFFGAGICAAWFLPWPALPFWYTASAALLLTAALLLERRWPGRMVVGMFAAFFLMLGFARTHYFLQPPAFDISEFSRESSLLVEGTVVNQPAPRGGGVIMRVSRLETVSGMENSRVTGFLFLRIRGGNLPLQRGDRLLVRTVIRPAPPDDKFLIANRIGAVAVADAGAVALVGRDSPARLSAAAGAARSHLSRRLERLMPEGLPLVIVKTVSYGLTRPAGVVRDDFRKAGVYHFLVVSGLHVGFWLLFMHLLLNPFSWHPRVKACFFMAGVALYAWLCNFSAPVVRASLMAVFYYLGIIINRPARPLFALSAAALLFVWVNPLFFFNPGWQLTFGITLGLVLFYPVLRDFFPRLPSAAAGVILLPVVAQAAGMPLVAFHFGYVPLLALLTNIFLLPLAATVVLLAFFSVLAGPVGVSAAAVNQFLAAFIYRMVQTVARLPWSVAEVSGGLLFFTFMPLLVLIFFAFWAHKKIQ